METDRELNELVRKAALVNAIKYGGRASAQSVMGQLMSQNPDLRGRSKELHNLIENIVKDVNRLDLVKQQAEYDQFAKPLTPQPSVSNNESPDKLPPLPNSSKYSSIVMRLAPYPSGPLHIGNARMVILNDEYTKRYKGKLILAYDDTIGGGGKEIFPEAYDLIKENLEWLGVKVHEIIYKSDRLHYYYDYARKLIEMGEAYVCQCAGDVFRTTYKIQKRPCPHRNINIDENLSQWEKMLNGGYQAGEAVLRLKTNMEDPNPALRDYVLLRITDAVHPRVGTKYRVWPLLEFNWAVDDHLLNITHILRGKDLIKEDQVEETLWNKFGWPTREFIHYGRLRFQEITLSKSFAAKNIKDKVFQGWNDPRTWSINSLRYRGIRPDAIREAILELGLTQVDIDFSPKPLYAINRRLIDGESNRFFGVVEPVSLTMKAAPKSLEAHLPRHPDHPERGARDVHLTSTKNTLKLWIDKNDLLKFQANDVVRLKDLCNIHIESIAPDYALSAFLDQDVETARKHKAAIIHWLPSEDNLPMRLLMPDGMTFEGRAESSLRELPLHQNGTMIQLERVGFVNVLQVAPIVTAIFAHK